MLGQDSNKQLLQEAFAKIKEDIEFLKSEVKFLRQENQQLKDDNKLLQRLPQLLGSINQNQQPKKLPTKKNQKLLKQRILELATMKRYSLAEIKDIILEEELCSKATFYRYIEKLKTLGLLDSMRINNLEIMVRI